jgi:pilus assembly protein CpaB
MGARRILVLLLALVAAGATAIYARSWIEGQQSNVTATAAPAPKEEIHEVLIADADLAAGTFIKPHHLRWQRWPTDDVPVSYVLRSARAQDEMVGAVVRRGIAAGTPLTDGAVVKPGDRGFLAAVLTPGMRAASVPVNPTSSNAGLIYPGDHVDLILTQAIQNENTGGTRRVSETVLRDIRIIAMGSETGDDPEEGKRYDSARTATFEVTPRQAEKIALVTELGKLSLSLRSLARAEDQKQAAPEANRLPYTWDSDVSRVLGSNSRLSSRLTVLRGAKVEDVAVQGAR